MGTYNHCSYEVQVESYILRVLAIVCTENQHYILRVSVIGYRKFVLHSESVFYGVQKIKFSNIETITGNCLLVSFP